MLNRDEEVDRLIRNALVDSSQPPEPPVDEMWAMIEQRAFRGADIVPIHGHRADRWRLPALAAAAALVFGTALGWSIAPRTTVARTIAAVPAPAPAAGVQRSLAIPGWSGSPTDASTRHGGIAPASRPMAPKTSSVMTLATTPGTQESADAGNGSDMVRYLAQTSALLASLPTTRSQARSDSAIAVRASDLLTQTHLLLDSRAGSDPTLHRLLEDLELVLAQVARLRGSADGADLQLIHQALTVHDVLPRVYDATLEASTTD